ncbi:MAG: HAD hydrolase family protein [Allobaculum sp.]|nr:HAD hydrolase family protein [Allobaculum sp.]
MKSIIFLDLDGTLWENEIIPPSALEAIQKAQENGHMVFANTGRSRGSAWFDLKDMPLTCQ